MNIYLTIRRETERFRDRTAVIEGEIRVSYGQLFSAVDMVAAGLKTEGVGPCDRVGILCADSIDYITTSLAVLSLSAVVVPVAPEQSASEIDAILDRINVQYLVSEKGTCDRADARPLPSAGFTTKTFCIRKRTAQEEPPEEYFAVNPAFIRFTSGTTGTSKGIVLSHGSIVDRTDAADKGLRITSSDTVLWVLSMSFHFVVTILLFLRRAATIVLCNRQFPESLIDGIIRHEGTFIYASPFHYNVLARSELLSPDALKKVRMAVSTAMKLPVAVAEEFQAKFGFELTEAYGIIEVGLPFMSVAGDRIKRGSVGNPLPDYELSIRNADASGVGEIWLKGKGMLDAYFSPWETRSGILTDGWFKTGDLGKVDADGCLFIMGRDKGVINFAGMKVFADEVEAVINQHPQVAESLVYAVAHAQYGQLPVAKVVLKNGPADLTELRRFCYQRLSPYKVPKDFEFVSELPKTASGKIRR
jgi:long-chain acyl-CoA synthetase